MLPMTLPFLPAELAEDNFVENSSIETAAHFTNRNSPPELRAIVRIRPSVDRSTSEIV